MGYREIPTGLVAIALLVPVLAACASRPPTPAAPAGICRIPLTSQADFRACSGRADQMSIQVPDIPSARTVARVVIPSTDPEVILQ